MATLGEAVRKLATNYGADVPEHATIGESLRKLAEHKGLDAGGNLSDVIEELAKPEIVGPPEEGGDDDEEEKDPVETDPSEDKDPSGGDSEGSDEMEPVI